MPDLQPAYTDEAYYPWVALNTKYASFFKPMSTGTDIYVYYQDHFQKLNQLKFSSAKENHGWHTTPIKMSPNYNAIPGTSLAVVNWGNSVRLYYINQDWRIAEACSDDDGETWTDGHLTAKKWGAHPESGLSAVNCFTEGPNIHVFYQDGSLALQSVNSTDGWAEKSGVVVPTDPAHDPLRAMLGSSLAFINNNTASDPRFVGFYQTELGHIQEILWIPPKSTGEGITMQRLSFDDTDFRTPIAASHLVHDGKNTVHLVYAKNGSVYCISSVGGNWGAPMLVTDKYCHRGGLTVCTRTFSAGGIKCFVYLTAPPLGIRSCSLEGDESKWDDKGGLIGTGTKHVVKTAGQLGQPAPTGGLGQPAPGGLGQPAPTKKEVEAVYYEKMRSGSKLLSLILDEKDPNPREYCLFYQAFDDSIQMLKYDEGTKKWEEKEVVPKGEARAGTPLAATHGDGYDNVTYIQLFFVNQKQQLASWATGYNGEGVWRYSNINACDVHPNTDLCAVKGGKYGYDFLFYQDPKNFIREIAQMGDWFDEDTKIPALPGTSIAFADAGDGGAPYRYKKVGVYQDVDGSLKCISKKKDSQYDYHDWTTDDNFTIPLSETSFKTPMSLAVTRGENGSYVLHLFHVDGEGNVKGIDGDEGGWKAWGQGVFAVDWKMPKGGSLSAAPHFWYNKDNTPARVYLTAPLNAVAEAVGSAKGEEYKPRAYGEGLVPIGGDTFKVKVRM